MLSKQPKTKRCNIGDFFKESTDLFGVPVILKLQQKEKYTTYLGSLISLAIYGLVLFVFITETIQLVSGANPTIINSVNGLSVPPVNSFIIGQKTILDPDHFFFTVALSDEKNNAIPNYAGLFEAEA